MGRTMNRHHRTWLGCRAALLAGALLAGGAPAPRADDFQGATHLMPLDEESTGYSRAVAQDAVARLQQRLEAGAVKLKFAGAQGYLPAVLEAFGISPTSQTLVFSKTSLQRDRIFPQRPRAVFFNDDVYVGFIPGAPLLEISVADPKLGGVFYTLEQVEQERPRLVRNNQCLECHASSKTMGVPGHLVRSFATDRDGAVDLQTGISLVTHRTPFSDRWGGWYVTGTHGAQSHRGNLVGPADFAEAGKRPNYHGNLTSIGRFFDNTPYPTPHSDIVALMVLTHQAHMHNFITRLHYEAAAALRQFGHLRYLRSQTDGFLRYLLCTEEARLTGAVRGTSGFAKWFAGLGPRDRRGRSLRDLDLETRLFQHPCSHLIYSEAFDALPAPMRAVVYQRLHDILTGKDTSPDFAGIPDATKRAILEILRDTKAGLPDYWSKGE